MARQDDRHTRTANADSKLDWPTPETLAAAKHARARALREMVLATALSVGTRVRERVAAMDHVGSARPSTAGAVAVDQVGDRSLPPDAPATKFLSSAGTDTSNGAPIFPNISSAELLLPARNTRSRMLREMIGARWPVKSGGRVFSTIGLPAQRIMLCILGVVLYGALISAFHAASVSTWAMAAIFVAATVSSIAGFAFSAICGAMLFHLIWNPVQVVQIMMLCSVGGQALMVWSLRRQLSWQPLSIFLLGAAVGLPFGLYVLLNSRPEVYERIIGIFLIVYATFMILRRPAVVQRQHALWDVGAGFLGGITGGAAAFPGAFVTIWCSFKGWDKERQRGLYQPFILIVQIAAIAIMAGFDLRGGSSHRAFDFTAIMYLPAMLLGCVGGMTCFNWMNDRQFALAVNALLVVSGASFLI